jgi:hypothetical protein
VTRRPDRVTVMSPQTRLALRDQRVSAGSRRPAIRPDSFADSARLAVLLRVHRRLALQTMSMIFAGIFGLPTVLSLLPDVTDVRLLGVPIVWLLLGVGLYPPMFLVARWHTRRAELVDDQLGNSA